MAETIRVISHLDADGLCSAGIILKLLLEYNKKFHLSIVKQLEKETVEKIEKEEYNVFLFTDIGSGQLNLIKNILNKAKVIILDHHPPAEEINSKNLIMINPHQFNINGGEDISASTLSYLVAKEFKIEGMESLAITGTIGDMQEKDGELNGINRMILENKNENLEIKKGLKAFGRVSKPLHKALAYSTEHIPGVSGDESSAIQFLSELGIELKKGENWRTLNDLSGEEEKMLITNIILKRLNKTENPQNIVSNIYSFKNRQGVLSDAHEFATILNSCGRQNLQSIGIMLCLGENKDALKMANGIAASYRRKLLKALKWVENKENEKVKREKDVCYIIGEDNINDTIIGTVCSILAGSQKISQDIIVGFANSENGVKVSGRLNRELNLNLGKMIKEVVTSMGGEGGGHEKAGGARIEKGQESEFIEKFEQTIKNIKG